MSHVIAYPTEEESWRSAKILDLITALNHEDCRARYILDSTIGQATLLTFSLRGLPRRIGITGSQYLILVENYKTVAICHLLAPLYDE
jgi:hypothetical protein